MRWKTIILLFTLLFSYFFSMSTSFAQSQTEKLRLLAQDALKKGNIDKWGELLKHAQKVFSLEKQKMTLLQRYNQKLWLNLLLFKYYQIKGVIPPIQNIQKFKEKRQLVQYISSIEKSIKYLQKSNYYLHQYYNYYQKISQKTPSYNIVFLQTALPLRISQTTRDGKIYLSLLKFALNNWSNHQKIKEKFKRQHNLLQQLRQRYLKHSPSKNKEVQQRQQIIAITLEKAQRQYKDIAYRQQHKQTVSDLLLWGGIGHSSVAFVYILTALYFQNKSANPHNSTPFELQVFADTGSTLFVTSGVLFALGISGIASAMLIRPSDKERAQAILKVQNVYLNIEQHNLRDINVH